MVGGQKITSLNIVSQGPSVYIHVSLIGSSSLQNPNTAPCKINLLKNSPISSHSCCCVTRGLGFLFAVKYVSLCGNVSRGLGPVWPSSPAQFSRVVLSLPLSLNTHLCRHTHPGLCLYCSDFIWDFKKPSRLTSSEACDIRGNERSGCLVWIGK